MTWCHSCECVCLRFILFLSGCFSLLFLLYMYISNPSLGCHDRFCPRTRSSVGGHGSGDSRERPDSLRRHLNTESMKLVSHITVNVELLAGNIAVRRGTHTYWMYELDARERSVRKERCTRSSTIRLQTLLFVGFRSISWVVVLGQKFWNWNLG